MQPTRCARTRASLAPAPHTHTNPRRQRDLNGHAYYEFEYTAKNPRYTRHSVAVVVVNDGAFSARRRTLGGPHELGVRTPHAWGLTACVSCLLLLPRLLPAAATTAGKFYTLTTGANEKRWGKMKDKLATMIKSFSLVNA